MDRITFEREINDSVQIGDTLFVLAGGAGVATPVELGPIVEIGDNFITVDSLPAAQSWMQTALPVLPTGETRGFFMFRKDNRANVSSLLGYFAEVHLELPAVQDFVVINDVANNNIFGINPAQMQSELFSISSEIFISSK